MKHQPLSADLLVGVNSIAEFTGLTARQLFYRLQNKMLPGFKIGSRWAARKSTLQTYIVKQESAARRRKIA